MAKKVEELKVSFYEYSEYEWMSREELTLELLKLLEDSFYMDFLHSFWEKLREIPVEVY